MPETNAVPITILEIEGDPDEAGQALWSFAASDVPGSPGPGDTVNVKRVDIVPGLAFLVVGGDAVGGDPDSVMAIAGDSDEEGQLDISIPLAVAPVQPGDSMTGQSYQVDGGTVVLVQVPSLPQDQGTSTGTSTSTTPASTPSTDTANWGRKTASGAPPSQG